MKRYEVTGKLNTPVDALTDAAIGDFIVTHFDDDMENMLIGAGAIRPAPTKPPASGKSESKPSGASKPSSKEKS